MLKHFSLSFALILLLSSCAGTSTQPDYADLIEADVASLQARMNKGELSSEQLVNFYLHRIEKYNRQGPELRAVISINKDAVKRARELDRLRNQGEMLGPLHGIPVLLKDNIDSVGLANTAGSELLKDNLPADNAFLVTRLQAAGAIILGKANLSEWANFRGQRSSSGWSALGGQARNPYDPSTSPCGSSGGSAIAVAANMVTIAVGTETDGSLVCPAAVNGIVTIKPTLGLISRDGIIPIAHSQDTAGPMARTLRDAVIMLASMQGKDSTDPASFATNTDWLSHLQEEGLKGKRIGIVRNLTGYHELLDKQFEAQLEILEARGAILVEDANIETLRKWSEDEFTVLLHEFKADLAAYLAGTDLPYSGLSDLIAANQASDIELSIYGQELFEMAVQRTEDQQQDYQQALARAKRLAGKEGIDAVLEKHNLHLLIAPTVSPAWKIDHINGDHYMGSASSAAAVAGYPHITVPMGFIEVPGSPALPVGLSFFGTANSEPVLIEAAYGYEQASQHRKPPPL
ncbi:amidase [Lacimicrobium alkaliphilum]|uniref:Amidase n=1 Tax=Lacimicrobium alkaliphilum TaxID=1526571 RepID=A0ABQ1RK07_9ALTE|nr:amidase [Lacimicrobium alkaliphilum]GGD73143.1 amidase [Lacimicrobium alkaliphilum]